MEYVMTAQERDISYFKSLRDRVIGWELKQYYQTIIDQMEESRRRSIIEFWSRHLKLKRGWLKRQAELARKDIETWPDWMRREAGLPK